jgi:hypothetical protein
MRRLLLIAIVTLTASAILTSCGPASTPIPASTSVPATTVPTDTPAPTNTPKPTSTPRPTNTPKPTNTPRPTPTFTPTPAPIDLSGKGNSIVNVEKWNGPALARIIYMGVGNFAVVNYGPDDERLNLLVNTIGKYEGTVPLDFLDGEQTVRLEVKSSGPWEMHVVPLGEVRFVDIPGKFDGKGDDVVYLSGDNPDVMKVDASDASGNFVIWGYGNSRNLLVNELAPYTGDSLMTSDTKVLAINAEGSWSIEIITR